MQLKKIKFELVDEGHVKIFATYPDALDEEKKILIGDIFSEKKGNQHLTSYSGKSSIQICGFDKLEGTWSCGRFNHSQDCCLVWNDIDTFLKKKAEDDKKSSSYSKDALLKQGVKDE